MRFAMQGGAVQSSTGGGCGGASAVAGAKGAKGGGSAAAAAGHDHGASYPKTAVNQATNSFTALGTTSLLPSHAGHDDAHGPELTEVREGDPRFLRGSVGPLRKEGGASTIQIPDGVGFHGQRGRQQNGNDKQQNNYSVTDANFDRFLGLLPKNPDTGETLNYVQHTQIYAAAGYLENFAPDVYAQLVANQNAGKGTVLGAAAHLMGLVKTADPAEAGVNPAQVPTKIPGTPVDARTYVTQAKDITGQEWARMHHPQSAFKMLKNLLQIGVPWDKAMAFSGDDGVSGAGRLNGVNNQDNKDDGGQNGGENNVWSAAAAYGGEAVIAAMLAGHSHQGSNMSQGPDSLTESLMNLKDELRSRGVAKDDRSSSAARVAGITAWLLKHNETHTHNESDDIAIKNKAIVNSAR